MFMQFMYKHKNTNGLIIKGRDGMASNTERKSTFPYMSGDLKTNNYKEC